MLKKILAVLIAMLMLCSCGMQEEPEIPEIPEVETPVIPEAETPTVPEAETPVVPEDEEPTEPAKPDEHEPVSGGFEAAEESYYYKATDGENISVSDPYKFLDEGYSIDTGKLIEMFSTSTDSRDDMLSLCDKILAGKTLLSSIISTEQFYTVLKNSAGEEAAYAVLEKEGFTVVELGELGDWRRDLVLTPEIKEQISAKMPDASKIKMTYCLIEGFAAGTILSDGKNEYFVETAESMASIGLIEVGKLYSVKELAEIIKNNIDSIFEPGEISNENPATGKPVIYLYPEKETVVSVNLDFDGKITYTYPAINNGWKVLAKPDGTLTNLADNSTHYYLFWEGTARPEWTYEKGFVVKGSETEKFLRENLAKMGLTPREYNDFITYWVPKMQENPYNLISFSGEEYSEIAKLTVYPEPDSLIRIHMMWKALDKPIEIEPQVLPTFERKGFTLVEWGGTELY